MFQNSCSVKNCGVTDSESHVKVYSAIQQKAASFVKSKNKLLWGLKFCAAVTCSDNWIWHLVGGNAWDWRLFGVKMFVSVTWLMGCFLFSVWPNIDQAVLFSAQLAVIIISTFRGLGQHLPQALGFISIINSRGFSASWRAWFDYCWLNEDTFVGEIFAWNEVFFWWYEGWSRDLKAMGNLGVSWIMRRWYCIGVRWNVIVALLRVLWVRCGYKEAITRMWEDGCIDLCVFIDCLWLVMVILCLSGIFSSNLVGFHFILH